ncbi:MAG: hypothetical protein VKJ24_10035 [Synechococcales bacterium]|nr:hypothetical protein [Synechococcales bacterium]
MAHSVLHQWTCLLSFSASAIGLFFLYNHPRIRRQDLDESQWMLFAMTFAYWIVHCIAAALQKWILPDWDWVMMNLKLTSAISILLTFSCALSLPLNHIADKQEQAE